MLPPTPLPWRVLPDSTRSLEQADDSYQSLIVTNVVIMNPPDKKLFYLVINNFNLIPCTFHTEFHDRIVFFKTFNFVMGNIIIEVVRYFYLFETPIV